jgi:sigma-E factor negative regulatory protein RseA
MQDREPTDPVRAALSALMDGDQSAAEQACSAWRSDAKARDDWHTYHLIGDLLRSDEHRCEPVHDAAFVARLRERLAVEPVILAPQSTASIRRVRRLRAWMAPAAVAAGFVAVAGALVVTRVDAPGSDARDLAVTASEPGTSVARVSAPVEAGSAPALQDNATLIRSTDLDRYLAAHRQRAGMLGPDVPRADVRNVSVTGAGR